MPARNFPTSVCTFVKIYSRSLFTRILNGEPSIFTTLQQSNCSLPNSVSSSLPCNKRQRGLLLQILTLKKMAKAPKIFLITPEETYMWWMKSACHLQGTCITAQSKLRLSFPWEFSQRDIKMLYDLTFIFRSQSFSQFLLIAMEEKCFGPSLPTGYLGVIFEGTATKHSVSTLRL